MSTFLLLVCLLTLLFAPPLFLGSESISGLPLFMMVCWKGVRIPLGMAIDLIPLLWASLHSSHPRWLLFRLHYGLHMRRGRLVLLRKHRWWVSLLRTPSQFIFLLHTALLWALHLVRVCAHFGRCFWCLSGSFYSRRYFLDSDGQFIARALTLSLSYEKAPGPSATEGRCFIRGDWRSSWFAERQVCSVHSVLLFNNNFPSFPRLLTIDPAGRACLTQVGRWCSGWYAACYASGYSSWYGYFWACGINWNAGCLRTRRELRPNASDCSD